MTTPASLPSRQLDRQQPVVRAQLQEWGLGRLVAGFEDPLGGDLAEVPMIPLVGHAIPGQGLLGELDRHLLVGDPDRCWLIGQATFPVQAPVAEADVALLIDAAGAEDRGEAACEVLVAEDASFDPVEHLGRAAPTILALQVRPVLLAVEVVDPGRVPLEQLVPGRSLARSSSRPSAAGR